MRDREKRNYTKLFVSEIEVYISASDVEQVF